MMRAPPRGGVAGPPRAFVGQNFDFWRFSSHVPCVRSLGLGGSTAALTSAPVVSRQAIKPAANAAAVEILKAVIVTSQLMKATNNQTGKTKARHDKQGAGFLAKRRNDPAYGLATLK